ncbi:MAG: hypothetical protein GX265_01175 [Mollicutes bacterium]|nr:hypothetical protein [Mollicutes bacterium]
MKKYQKIGYIIMAIILSITIILILIIHSFNSTPVTGDSITTTTTKKVQYGD